MSLNPLNEGSGVDSRAMRTSGLSVDGASAGEKGRSTCGGSVAHAAKLTARTNTKARDAIRHQTLTTNGSDTALGSRVSARRLHV